MPSHFFSLLSLSSFPFLLKSLRLSQALVWNGHLIHFVLTCFTKLLVLFFISKIIFPFSVQPNNAFFLFRISQIYLKMLLTSFLLSSCFRFFSFTSDYSICEKLILFIYLKFSTSSWNSLIIWK